MQTQVLPYLRELVKGGIEVHLLTFEQKRLSAKEIEEKREKLAKDGISWNALKYHKRFSVVATLYDIACGAWFAWKFIRREKPDILHARIHFPALMALAARALSSHKPKLLFDIRGFIPEEYTDAGRWKENGIIYKTVKFLEKVIMRRSDGFVVLTEKAREILFPESKESGFDKLGRPVEVIPCCVDLSRFEKVGIGQRESLRRELGLGERKVIAYVGSFGGFYMANETADFYGEARKLNKDTFALILTQTGPELIRPLLESHGFSEKDFLIKKVGPGEIADYLSIADIALSFIKPCYSKLSSSPTKNAEYLACGLPIIANSGVGDVKEHIEEDGVGYIIDDFKQESFQKALAGIERLLQDEDLAERCRASAENRYHLENTGGQKYRRLYQMIKTTDSNKTFLD